MLVNGTPLHALIALAVVAAGCAGERPAQDPAPTAISLPAPWLDPVFFRESQMPTSGRVSERARCIDAEVERRELNSFGDPRGTVYAEGAPVGVKTTSDRYRYILQRNPGIGTLCSKAIGEPDL